MLLRLNPSLILTIMAHEKEVEKIKGGVRAQKVAVHQTLTSATTSNQSFAVEQHHFELRFAVKKTKIRK